MRYPLLIFVCVLTFHLYGGERLSGSAVPPGTIFVGKGNNETESININYFDKSRLEVEYLSVLRDRDQRAYEFLCSSVEALHGGFRDLSQTVQMLRQLSDSSLIEPLGVQEFLSPVRTYQQLVGLLNNQMFTLALLPTLKTDARKELSAKIDFTPLTQHYQQQLFEMEELILRKYFMLILPSGVVYRQLGIDTAALRDMSLYSAEQLNNMKKQADLKKMMKTEEKNIIDQGINAFTRNALETFIDTFGTSQSYRTSSDEDGQKQAAEALSDAFWARFYIRATYGIKIGSIQVIYQKRIFNLDYLISSMKIGALNVWNSSHLQDALHLATEAQATYQYPEGGLSLRSINNWITGSTAAEDAKKFIVDLIRTDLEQELTLGKSGGLKEVRASYRKLYFVSDEQKNIFQKKATLVFGLDDSDDPEADVAVIEPGTLRGVIAQCISVLQRMEVRLEEARQIESSWTLLVGDNKIINRRKKRTEL